MELHIVKSVCFLLVCIPVIKSKAIFHGKDDPNKVEHEYIIVINAQKLENVDDLPSFKSRIEETYGIKTKGLFEFGTFRAIAIQTNQSIDDLLEENDIDFIETNQKFSLDHIEGYDTEILNMKQFDLAEADSESNNVSYCYMQTTKKDDLWGLGRVNQRDSLKLFSNPYYSWSNYDNGTGVYAYVMDTGVYIDHSDFKGRATHGFTSPGIAEYEDSKDYKGHGTHVAGTIGGTLFGVAKNVNIIAVKVLDGTGSGTTVDLVEGLQYVYNDYISRKQTSSKPVKVVVNLSLGAAGSAPVLEKAVMACVDNNIHMVVAAGNEYDDACLYTPARVSEVITVGSSTDKDKLSSFSNYGPCVDIIAPGSDISSAWITGTSSIAKASGTSMASPHVAGIVARYLSRPWGNTIPTTAEVRDYIIDLATNDILNLNVGKNGDTAASSTPNKLLYMQCTTSTAAHSISSAVLLKFEFIVSVMVIFTSWCLQI